jgi:hypothetical protein
MSLVFGYIYIRLNDWYLFKNICKLGKTENIPNRNHHYMTGEPDSGYFYKVFKVKIDEMDEIETLLKNHFYNYNYKNIYNKGGLEFFNNTIIELIPSVLNSHNYYYELLSQEKIDQLTRNDENRNDENRNDEVHHLTSQNYNKQDKTRKFSNMIDIPCSKRISLTATLKLIECKEDENILSNDNLNIFGEIIFRLNLYHAIKQDIVCDYQIQNIIANEEQLQEQLIKYNIQDVREQRLFLSSYIALKSINENTILYDKHITSQKNFVF